MKKIFIDNEFRLKRIILGEKWLIFKDNYWDSSLSTDNPYAAFNLFLLNEKIGLQYIGFVSTNNYDLKEETYEIIDEQLWMLAKIKYGL